MTKICNYSCAHCNDVVALKKVIKLQVGFFKSKIAILIYYIYCIEISLITHNIILRNKQNESDNCRIDLF